MNKSGIAAPRRFVVDAAYSAWSALCSMQRPFTHRQLVALAMKDLDQKPLDEAEFDMACRLVAEFGAKDAMTERQLRTLWFVARLKNIRDKSDEQVAILAEIAEAGLLNDVRAALRHFAARFEAQATMLQASE